MNVLYFDCFSGISGDMTLGALLDLGIDKQKFLNELNKLNVEGFEIEISKVKKNGIEARDVNVKLHAHDCNHKHGSEHGCVNNHEHEHHHRNLKDIEEILDKSCLNKHVKDLSKDMFMKVASAEAKIHGTTIENIHFHEVGALDSIVDIVGVAICIDFLKVDKIISSPLHDGSGFVKCQHGLIPVPAPATLEILRAAKVPFYTTGIKNELVTPTGAAIIATLAQGFGNMEEISVDKVGYGAGKRDLEIPNLLRVILGKFKKKS